MDGQSSHPARPQSASESTSRQSRVPSNVEEGGNFQKAHDQSNPARVNPASPEVISNLIFSLSAISDESEQLLDKLVPAQEKESRPPSSRGSKRIAAGQGLGASAGPPLSPAPKGDATLANQPIYVAENDRQSEAGPSTSTAISSRKHRLPAALPSAAVPRRSVSIRRQEAPTAVENDELLVGESFGSVSVTPGRGENFSIESGESSAQKPPALGRSVSRAKSTKDRIKELDAERKKRLSNRSGPRPPNLAKNGAANRSRPPNNSTGFKIPDAVPKPANIGNETASNPPQDPHLPDQHTPNVSTPGHVGPRHSNDAANWSAVKTLKQPAQTQRIEGSGVSIPPRASSARHSLDSPEHVRPNLLELSPTGTSLRAKHNPDLPRSVVERDEAGTNQRIQELKAQTALRKRKEAATSKKVDDKPTATTGEINQSWATAEFGEKEQNVMDRADSLPRLSLSGALAQKSATGSISGVPFESRGLSAQARVSTSPSTPSRIRGADTFSVTDSIDDAIEDYVSDPRLSRKIYHQSTGRCVSYSDVGDPEGFIVICCVGMGTTRYVTAFFDELARTLKLRLITPERPGIGESEPYTPDDVDTPLGWPDDIRLICQHLNIARFSLLAHSAGAVYALATALRMPTNIRGRVHILAPWIPPSQLIAIGLNQEPVPVAELPLIQRILRAIPEPLLEAATRIFNMSSITSSLGKSPYGKRRRNTLPSGEKKPARVETPAPPPITEYAHLTPSNPMPGAEDTHSVKPEQALPLRRPASALDVYSKQEGDDQHPLTEEERETEFNTRLTSMIWHLATSNANPAVDLMVCLERKQEIGFRYEDITKPVVMHHGTKDTRVSVENVVWLGDKMRRCEVRILEGEGHGLMASPIVMSDVLVEMAKDWEDWNAVVKGRRG